MEQTHNYAGFWRRFLASLVDGVILGFVRIGVSLSLGTINISSEDTVNIVDSIISFVIGLVYTILFWINYDGATPGKKLLAIKIVTIDQKPLNLGISIIRYFSYLVSLIPLLLGYIWVAWDKKKQGWHDKIAGTYVVKTDKNPRIGLAIIIALLGMIALFGAYFAIGLSSNTESKKKFEEIIKDDIPATQNYHPEEGDQEKILSYAPSNCSLSIPVPKTEDTKDSKQRKWVYEELEAEKGAEAINFYVLDSDTYSFANSGVLLSNISYKNPQQLLGKNEDSFAFTGLNVWCTDNYKNLSLDEFKSLALLNKKLSIKEQGKFRWGELEVIAVNLQGTLPDGFKLNEPGYIAVTKDGKKLLYLRQWGASLQDPIHDQLTTDLSIIIRNLKFR